VTGEGESFLKSKTLYPIEHVGTCEQELNLNPPPSQLNLKKLPWCNLMGPFTS